MKPRLALIMAMCVSNFGISTFVLTYAKKASESNSRSFGTTTYTSTTEVKRKETPLLQDSDLASRFAQNNRKYFNNKLPIETKIQFHKIDQNIWQYGGVIQGYQEGSNLFISEELKDSPSSVDTALLHEMAHESVWLVYPLEGHGPHWKQEMRRLAYLGGFDNKLWEEEVQ